MDELESFWTYFDQFRPILVIKIAWKIALKFKLNFSFIGNAFEVRIRTSWSHFGPILTYFVQFRPILVIKIAWKIALKFKWNLSSMGNAFEIRIRTSWSHFSPILTNFVQFRPTLVIKIACKIALKFKFEFVLDENEAIKFEKNILGHFWPFRAIFDYLIEAIKFEKVESEFDIDFCRFGTFQTILGHFGPFLTIKMKELSLKKLKVNLTFICFVLGLFRPFWAIFDY